MGQSRFNRVMLVTVLVTPPAAAAGQSCPEVRKDRIAIIAGAYVATQVIVMAARSDDWWNSPSEGFHFARTPSLNKQQDGLQHAWLGYQVSQISALAWDSTCVGYVKAGWLGALTGVAIGLPKEIIDGFHGQGFSLRQFLWNAAGSTLPAIHRAVPDSRSILFKFFYWPSEEYRNKAPSDFVPQLETDYAGMRFYLAYNPGRRPGGPGGWPAWLGVAMGHSVPYWVNQPPIDEWYFTLDLNARGLPIRAHWWPTVAAVIDQFHIPLPGFRLRGGQIDFGLF